MPYDPLLHGPRRVVGPGFREKVYAVVQRVPRGSVTTYGDVGRILGLTTIARQVGYALAALPTHRRDVPWHRVVNGRGQVSVRTDGRPSPEQCRRLAREGVRVSREGRVPDFARVRWPRATPEAAARLAGKRPGTWTGRARRGPSAKRGSP